MKKIFPFLFLFAFGAVCAQTYQPDWESLDSRPVPRWFKDAKFGIFIHWGVYAVPGWCTKGNYAEWYQYGLQTTDSARMRFHKAKFGDRSYYDLANDFKAELFNPDEWARVFENSGAKYIVLTSKHHDGFTLWPSAEANRTWGFPWNAVDIGPKRDLLGDLFKAVRKTSVHPGMYYSLFEWFNPLWKKDKAKYAMEHAWPQMKELVNTYRPDVFWTDGDWEAGDEVWKSKEFLAWLYNESPVKNSVVTYDRWGSNIRFRHGAVFTPEYQPDLDFEDHYWEESRGMGFSYGYNREEDAWDYNSTRSLVLQLVDKASRGGNFLLDIGPDEHGKIPPIMQERLLQMGEWLRINGEAVYNTQRWRTPSQWSEGRRDYKPASSSGDLLLKLTVDPDPGYAVKEIFFTYNAAANDLYAVFPRYPENRKLLIKDLSIPQGTDIRLLSMEEKLIWKQSGEDIDISLPEYNPEKFKAPYAYAVRIRNAGRFYAKPKIRADYSANPLRPLVSLTADNDAQIIYTTDGSEPGKDALTYNGPFIAEKTMTVKARALQRSLPPAPAVSAIPSAISEMEIKTYSWMPALKIPAPRPGIAYRYFEPEGRIDMRALQGKESASGISPQISIDPKKRPDKFALEFNGYIRIGADGIYHFFLESDDGSRLFIDEAEVINNDGDHGAVEKAGKAALKKGYHKINVRYFDSGGGNTLKLSLQREGGKKEALAATLLFH